MSNTFEYTTFNKEMNRRRIAFLSLELSLLITICFCFYEYIMISPLTSLILISLCSIIMLFIYFKVAKMLDKQKEYKFYIIDNKLVRQLLDIKETYIIDDIDSMRVKRTSKNNIREINFNMTNKNTIFINGIDDKEFERFLNEILSINNDIAIKEFKEPINLDHTLFYPILGIILGIITSFAFKLMLNINEVTYMYVKNIISVFIILIGIFWIIKKPTSRTYGKSIVYKDIIVGTIFILVGVAMVIFLSY